MIERIEVRLREVVDEAFESSPGFVDGSQEAALCVGVMLSH